MNRIGPCSGRAKVGDSEECGPFEATETPEECSTEDGVRHELRSGECYVPTEIDPFKAGFSLEDRGMELSTSDYSSIEIGYAIEGCLLEECRLAELSAPEERRACEMGADEVHLCARRIHELCYLAEFHAGERRILVEARPAKGCLTQKDRFFKGHSRPKAHTGKVRFLKDNPAEIKITRLPTRLGTRPQMRGYNPRDGVSHNTVILTESTVRRLHNPIQHGSWCWTSSFHYFGNAAGPRLRRVGQSQVSTQHVNALLAPFWRCCFIRGGRYRGYPRDPNGWIWVAKLCRSSSETLDESALFEVPLATVSDHQSNRAADPGDCRQGCPQHVDTRRWITPSWIKQIVDQRVSNPYKAQPDNHCHYDSRQQRYRPDATENSDGIQPRLHRPDNGYSDGDEHASDHRKSTPPGLTPTWGQPTPHSVSDLCRARLAGHPEQAPTDQRAQHDRHWYGPRRHPQAKLVIGPSDEHSHPRRNLHPHIESVALRSGSRAANRYRCSSSLAGQHTPRRGAVVTAVRGDCVDCRGNYALRGDGLVRVHGITSRGPCTGSMRPPAARTPAAPAPIAVPVRPLPPEVQLRVGRRVQPDHSWAQACIDGLG